MQSFAMAFFIEHSFGEINLCCVFQSFFYFLNHSVVFHHMNELLILMLIDIWVISSLGLLCIKLL